MKRVLYPSFLFLIRRITVCIVALALFVSSSRSQGPGPFTMFGGIDASGVGGYQTFSDATSVVAGLRFQVAQIGTITELHFFNESLVNQTYTVSLWEETSAFTSGTLLQSGTFTGIPSGGGGTWNTVDIPDVRVMPYTTYVVTLHIPNGDYSIINGGVSAGDQVYPSGANPAFTLIGGTGSAIATSGNGTFLSPATTTEFPTTDGTPSLYLLDATIVFDYPLPVTLTNLKATPDAKNVAITWQTQSEQNNKGFEIQRSNNNVDWYNIGFVNGIGNSSGTTNYSFIDKELAPGKYFYRLQQTDIDNRSKLSSTVMATLSGKGKTSLFQNSPNPVRTTTLIRFDLSDAQKVRLSLFDMAGREVQTLVNKVAEQGSHVITVNASALSKQFYIIKLQTETETIIKRMLVQ